MGLHGAPPVPSHSHTGDQSVRAAAQLGFAVCVHIRGFQHFLEHTASDAFMPFIKVFCCLQQGLQRLLSSGFKGYSDWKSLVRTGNWELDQRQEGFLPAVLLWGSILCPDWGEGEHEQNERAEQKNSLKCCLFPGDLSFVPKTHFYIWRTCHRAELSVLANHTPGKGKIRCDR